MARLLCATSRSSSGGRGRCAARAVGKRQVDTPARARRARAALPRGALLRVRGGGRSRHAVAWPGGARRHRRHGLPGSGGPGRDDARRKRGRLRSREPRHAAHADLAAGRTGARGGRGGALAREKDSRALGRRAAARLPCFRARSRAGAALARRADVAARRERSRCVSRRGRAGTVRGRALRATRRPGACDCRSRRDDGGGPSRPRCAGGGRPRVARGRAAALRGRASRSDPIPHPPRATPVVRLLGVHSPTGTVRRCSVAAR